MPRARLARQIWATDARDPSGWAARLSLFKKSFAEICLLHYAARSNRGANGDLAVDAAAVSD
jgi:hypothetical protein